MDKDLYELLGVASNADAREIKKAYFQKVREFPPETHSEQFQLIRRAYETLSDPDRRRGYDASRGDAWSALGQELAAVMRAASEAMQKDEFESASRLLEAVVAQRPEAEEPRARLCSCLLNLEQWARASAAAQAFIDHHPKSVVAHLFKGYAANGVGQLYSAREAFLQVLELDPNDFRAYRGVVDTHFNDGKPANALSWLEGVADQPTDRDARRLVAMEMVALRVHLGQPARGLEALSSDAKDEDERDEFRRFAERLVAIALGRATGKGPALLKQLQALGVRSDLISLATTTTLPLTELPESTRVWLARQRKQPEIFFIPGVGPLTDALVAAGAVTLLVGLLWALFTSHVVMSWDIRLTLAPIYAAAGLFAGWACVRLVRSLLSPLGRFTCLHPVWFIEVDLDHVHFRPLAATKIIRATHHHSNLGYTHSSFALSFGDSGSTVSINSKSHAEEFLNLVQRAQQRLLDLGHSGLVGAVEGVELVSPEQRGQKVRLAWRRRRDLVGGLMAAAAACVVALVGAVTSSSRAEAREFDNALKADPRSPQLVRQFVTAHPQSEHGVEAAAALTRRRESLLTELKPLAAGLAEALEAHTEPTPLAVSVVFAPTVSAGPMTSHEKGRVVADVPADLYGPERRRRFEQELVTRLQASFDARFGASWVAFSSKTSAKPTLTVSYRLTNSGRAFGLWSEDPERGSDVMWAEPQAEVTAALGTTTVQATLTPPASVALRADVAKEVSVHGASSLYAPLADALWLKVIDVVAGAIGITSKPG